MSLLDVKPVAHCPDWTQIYYGGLLFESRGEDPWCYNRSKHADWLKCTNSDFSFLVNYATSKGNYKAEVKVFIQLHVNVVPILKKDTHPWKYETVF